MANIFQTRYIQNSQTKNQNRFTLRFLNLDQVLQRAKNHRIQSVRNIYAGAERVLKRDNFDFAQTLELGLLSVNAPTVTIEKQRIPRFNDSVGATTKFADPEDMAVTFLDYVNGSPSAILKVWHSLVGDKTTGYMGFKEEYILEKAHLYKYGPDAPGYTEAEIADSYLEKHEIINLHPLSVPIGEMSYENGEAIRIEAQFSIDNIYIVDYQGYIKDNAGNFKVG